MLKHLFTIIATILVVSSALKAQLHDLVYGVYGPGLVTVTGDCYTDSNWGDLTFVPGTTVQFNDHYQILIVGGTAMYANGTEAAPILFTSPPGNPTAGYWKALIAAGASGSPATMTLTNCEIRYGGEHESNVFDALGPVRGVDYSTITVTDCHIHDNWGSGAGTDHTGDWNNILQISDSRIENCDTGVKLMVSGSTSYVLRNWIQGCDNGMIVRTDPAIQNVKISNNVVKACTTNGIYVYGQLSHFYNNLIDGRIDASHQCPVGMYISVGIYPGVPIENNIIVDNSDFGIESESQITIDYNCFYQNDQAYNRNVRSTPANELRQDPVYTADFGDENYYHLLWNSPCLGTGYDELTNSNPAISCSMP
jgi:hypothetical protein